MTTSLDIAFHIVAMDDPCDYTRLIELVMEGADVNTIFAHRTALVQAICANNQNLAIFLIEMGADVNQNYPTGWRPQHFAVTAHNEHNEKRAQRSLVVIQSLLAYGADPSAVAERVVPEETPLQMAQRLGKHDLVDLFLQYL